MTVLFQKLDPAAQLPRRATGGAAGYDLCACIRLPLVAEPGQTVSVPTGLAMALPKGYGGFIFARSGLGIRHGVVPGNCVGVIDSDYRGEVLVGLHNHSDTAYTIQPGERIAQLMIAPVVLARFLPCEELGSTDRGEGGFGSTGRLGGR